MSKKYFGTDGIRGHVGEPPITAEFMLKLGWAVGRVLANDTRNHVLIGKDTRISGYMFESALEAGLSAAGMNIGLLGPMPTPAIAYLTRTFHAQAGIVVSASHNPYGDNGVKFFGRNGMKLPDSLEEAIEAEMDKTMFTVKSAELGKARRIDDAPGRYIEFCKSTLPMGDSLRGLKLVVDCAHGATYHVAPNVFRELGAEVHKIGVSPDGLNINENCGATKPKILQQTVLQQEADLGIALDGDGDRLIMVDHQGEVVDGDELLFIIAQARHRAGELTGPVVGTLMSNMGLEVALKALGVEFLRGAVGDRYVLELLREHHGMLGGESSGHLLCLDRTSTGDGIISALQVLHVILDSGLTLHELKQGMDKFPQQLINVRLPSKQEVVTLPEVQAAVEAAEQQLGQQGRVLLRPSGTEPLIRVMVEAVDATRARQTAKELAAVVERCVSPATGA